MKSAPFRSSRQSQDLLQYIVDKSLSGHTELLKERVIGIEVFGRRPDYDTNGDPIVRARVAEVRKRLALYYQTEHANFVRISVPPGSFKASFEWLTEVPVQAPAAHIAAPGPGPSPSPVLVSARVKMESGPEPLPKRLPVRAVWVLLCAVAVILLTVAMYPLLSPESRAFNRFWSPVLDNPNTALIYVGSNAVYQLSNSYMEDYHRQHPPNRSEEMGFESFVQLPQGTKIDAKDLLPAENTFVTIGDVAAVTKVESVLLRRNRPFDIRYGKDVSFGDIRQSPTILIGAHNNSWTLAMTGNLRYVFSGPNAIVDRANPQKRWTTNESFIDDYAVISRIVNSKTDTTVIAVAGVGYAGTQAAAEFLTTPRSISTLVKGLPKGWQTRNLQIVLHTTVTNQLPAAPEVVATYSW